jgi:hypothetical protein
MHNFYARFFRLQEVGNSLIFDYSSKVQRRKNCQRVVSDGKRLDNAVASKFGQWVN